MDYYDSYDVNNQTNYIGRPPGEFLYILSIILSVLIVSFISAILYHKYNWNNEIKNELRRLKVLTNKFDNNIIYCPEICVICLENFKEHELISKLECNHSYHEHCIKEWIINKLICPYCKN